MSAPRCQPHIPIIPSSLSARLGLAYWMVLASIAIAIYVFVAISSQRRQQ